MPTVITPDTKGLVERLSAAAGSAVDRGPKTKGGNIQDGIALRRKRRRFDMREHVDGHGFEGRGSGVCRSPVRAVPLLEAANVLKLEGLF